MKTLQFEALGQNTKSSGNHLRLQESIRKSTRESTRESTEESTRDSLVESLWKWLTAKRLYSKTENMHWSTHKQEIDLTYLVDKTFRMLVQEARRANGVLKNFLELCKREITKFWASTKNYRLLIKKFEEALALGNNGNSQDSKLFLRSPNDSWMWPFDVAIFAFNTLKLQHSASRSP